MKNVVELRARAALCRQLAVREPTNRSIWLAEAGRWSHLAQDDQFETSAFRFADETAIGSSFCWSYKAGLRAKEIAHRGIGHPPS